MVSVPNYETLFSNFVATSNNYSKGIFTALLPYFETSIYDFVIKCKKNGKGPKPKKANIVRFLKAFFSLLSNGCKIETAIDQYNVSRGTFYRYLNLLQRSNLLEQFHSHLLAPYNDPALGLLDATHIRSVNGSDHLGYGHKEHSKKALKITIVTNTNKVIYQSGIVPDNKHDLNGFEALVVNNPSKHHLDILADSAYNGKRFKGVCEANNYHIISPQKKFHYGASEPLSKYQKVLLRKHRSKMEHVFSQLNRFRAIQIKYTKSIWVYKLFLQLAILIISIHNGIIRGGLKSPTRIVINRINR